MQEFLLFMTIMETFALALFIQTTLESEGIGAISKDSHIL